MGSNLRRQLREALPPGIKGLPRAVALEIADDARYDDAWRYDPEHGRRSKVRLAELVRWTASKNERVIRDALRNLSLAGWEFRLPMGKDKTGNLLYAVPGHALEFRVPDFETPTVVGPAAEGTVTTGPTGTVTTGPSPEGVATTAQGPVTTAEGPVVTAEGPVTTVTATVTTGPPSPISSSSPKESPSSSPVVEADEDVTETVTTEGGGGGDQFSEELNKQSERIQAFVASLPFPGRPPGKQQQTKIRQRISAAFKAGWSEKGLRRYLDISDDPNVRSAAALYLHRLSEDELPPAVDESALPPPCGWCSSNPAAATDPTVRVNPITGDPCPQCHPAAVGKRAQTKLPPACSSCLAFSPGAATNVRMRSDHLSFHGGPCPRCHPSMVPGDWYWAGMDTADGGMWERAMGRAKARMGARAESHSADDYTNSSVEDLFAHRGRRRTLQPADSNEREFAPRPMVAPPRHQPFKNPTDQSVYDEPLLGDVPAVDQSAYDEPL